MLFDLFLTGALVGLCISMPIGPINILCIRNSLTWGKKHGFVTGMGAATADAFYGAIAGLGVVALMSVLMIYIDWLKLIGGIFLCYLGLTTLRARVETPHVKTSGGRLLKLFATTFFITLANPLTVFALLGIYAAFGLGVEAITPMGLLTLTAGIFLGATCWWLALTFGARLFARRFDAKCMHWLNYVSGSILILFGVAALLI
jgi:threonine/homoserine/homoserine lactone efflux protein